MDRFIAMEGFLDKFRKNKMQIYDSSKAAEYSTMKDLVSAAAQSDKDFFIATYKGGVKINIATKDMNPSKAEKYIENVLRIAPQVHKNLCQKLKESYPNQSINPSSIKLMAIHYAAFSNGSEIAELSFDDGNQFHGHIITTEIGPNEMRPNGKYTGTADDLTFGMQG